MTAKNRDRDQNRKNEIHEVIEEQNRDVDVNRASQVRKDLSGETNENQRHPGDTMFRDKKPKQQSTTEVHEDDEQIIRTGFASNSQHNKGSSSGKSKAIKVNKDVNTQDIRQYNPESKRKSGSKSDPNTNLDGTDYYTGETDYTSPGKSYGEDESPPAQMVNE